MWPLGIQLRIKREFLILFLLCHVHNVHVDETDIRHLKRKGVGGGGCDSGGKEREKYVDKNSNFC